MAARSFPLGLCLWEQVAEYTFVEDVARISISARSVYKDTYPLLCDIATYIVIPFRLWRVKHDEMIRLEELAIAASAAKEEREMDDFIRRTHCWGCSRPFADCDCPASDTD